MHEGLYSDFIDLNPLPASEPVHELIVAHDRAEGKNHLDARVEYTTISPSYC